MIIKEEAVKIIDKWCTIAHRKKMSIHKKHFWAVRDLLEGTVQAKTESIKMGIIWIKANCAESADKTILMAALNEI